MVLKLAFGSWFWTESAARDKDRHRTGRQGQEITKDGTCLIGIWRYCKSLDKLFIVDCTLLNHVPRMFS